MVDHQEYIQEAGTTRDCQKRRLTESVYVDCEDAIRRVHDILSHEVDFRDTLTTAGIALTKLYFYAVFLDGRCFVPTTIWKSVTRAVIALSGGVVHLRVYDPEFLTALQRDNRNTKRGSEVRGVVIDRFLEGLRNA